MRRLGEMWRTILVGRRRRCVSRSAVFFVSDANVYVTLTLPEYTLRMIAVKMLIVGEIESHAQAIW